MTPPARPDGGCNRKLSPLFSDVITRQPRRPPAAASAGRQTSPRRSAKNLRGGRYRPPWTVGYRTLAQRRDHLGRRTLAGFGGSVDVAGPAGRGLGAGEVDRADRLAQRGAVAGQHPRAGERAVAAAAVLLGAPVQ